MAGTWQALVNGFAGMRMHHGKLSFKPHLPKKWNRLTFRVQYKKAVIEVSMGKEEVSFKLLHGEPICIYLKKKEAEEKMLRLEEGETIHEKV